MIINTLMDKRGLACAFSKYIPQNSKYQYKNHVVATKAGFKNWEQLIGLLRDPDMQDAIRGVESFIESETAVAVHEGIHAWLEYRFSEAVSEEFNQHKLLRILMLFYFVYRNEAFTAYHNAMQELGFLDVATVPLLSEFNLGDYDDDVVLRSVYRFFQRDAEDCLLIDTPLFACFGLTYFAVTLEDGIRCLLWELEHGKRSFLNQHIYSQQHKREFYLKLYGGDPVLLVCDDTYPEGLAELCKSLGVVYAGEEFIHDESFRLGMKAVA